MTNETRVAMTEKARLAALAGHEFKCPECGGDASKVVNSRAHDRGRRRTRKCRDCGSNLHTIEIPLDQAELAVSATVMMARAAATVRRT